MGAVVQEAADRGSTTTTLLEALGGRSAEINFEHLDTHGVELIRASFVDTLGVALAGSISDGVSIARTTCMADAATGRSLVLGTSQRLGSLDAGMLNGMAAHSLDYDDGNIVLAGHPSAVLVPAVLALGEEIGACQQDAAVAYAAGYEVLVRVARGVNPSHYEKGWHPTSTIGVLGVAAAGARLLGLNTEKTTVALAVACSMASGIKANFGTMVKGLHVGQSIRSGLLAAKLAASGFTANSSSMEAAQGFLNVYNGEGQYDVAAITANMGGKLEVNRGVNPIKVYPCCASTHSGVRAAQDLRSAHNLAAGEIDAVTVVVDERRMPHTDRPILNEAGSGKFSLQYVIARALITGRIGLADFEGDSYRDRDTVALMSRVEVVSSLPSQAIGSFAADLTVTMSSGETVRTVVDPHADPGLLANEEQLWEKFADCVGRVLPADRVGEIASVLREFPGPGDLAKLMAMAEIADNAIGREEGHDS